MKQQERAEAILRVSIQNPEGKASWIAKELNFPERTVRNVLKRLSETGSTQRKLGSGRKAGTGDVKREKKIIAALHRNPNLSNRDLGSKFLGFGGNLTAVTENCSFSGLFGLQTAVCCLTFFCETRTTSACEKLLYQI